jgi:hypothetical protein
LDETGEPSFIDCNPRLAEIGNAMAAGINMPNLLVQVSLGRRPPRVPIAPSGIRSYMAIQGLLRTASERRSRAGVLRTMWDVMRRRGIFSGGAEELTPVTRDPECAIALAAVSAALLVAPGTWRRFSSSTIGAYAASPAVVRFVRQCDIGRA